MTSTPNGTTRKRVAFLLEKQFEDSEFKVPHTALQQAGASITILGARMNDEYKGKRGHVSIRPDATATEARSEDFDAIIIPGGNAPDHIRANPNAVRLVMNAIAQGKLIAAVCHGPQVLIEADQLHNRVATGFRSIRKDIQNAGATYVNEPVVTNHNLITARQPSDLAIFTTAILSYLGLSIEGTTLPETSNQTFEWWQLAADWGGSSRNDIVNALNTTYMGERYTLDAFREYGKRVTDSELHLLLSEAVTLKEHYVQILENRLRDFNEHVSWQAAASDAYARLQGWLQQNANDMSIVRRALGDIQTGVVDLYRKIGQLTDPKTVVIFDELEGKLAMFEERFGAYYRARAGTLVEPPMPTTLGMTG